MLQETHQHYADALEAIDIQLLSARIEVARVCKFESALAAIAVLKVKPRAYYKHERGQSRPDLGRLRLYADMFGAPLDYLLFGAEAEKFEAKARELAQRKGDELQIDTLTDAKTRINSNVNAPQINQLTEQTRATPSHNQSTRLIVLLTASEIRKLSNGLGELATMSGPMLSVPDFLQPSRRSFWYRVPFDDRSMVSEGGLINPGGFGIIDLEAKIIPGDFVLADLSDGGVVLRTYVAARSYQPGVSFELKALNPAYKPIEVPLDSECLSIGKLVFFGNSL